MCAVEHEAKSEIKTTDFKDKSKSRIVGLEQVMHSTTVSSMFILKSMIVFLFLKEQISILILILGVKV